jgi:superoxide dismutase
MNRMINTLLLAGAMAVGAQAMAQEQAQNTSRDNPNSSSSSGSINTHEMMRECMAKAKKSNNGMSEQDMKKACQDQIKSQVDHPNQKKETVTPQY